LACTSTWACAGELERPERFDGVLAALDGSVVAAMDSGSPPLPADSGGAASDSGAAPDAPPACVTDLFEASCGTAGCHNAGAPQVDLVSEGVTGRLLDQPSSSALCSGRTFIASGGGASLLLDKLMATPPCGSRMPLVGTLTSAQQTCLEQWVQSLGGTP
jgi:hypothetical protein